MAPLPLSYNLCATNCAKEVISAAVPLEEGLSVSQHEMMQSLDTLIEDEGERKRCYDFLNKLKEDIQQAKEGASC
jgi:hypothetical protein